MCMICNHVSRLTMREKLSNLFELKELMGKKHASEVLFLMEAYMEDDGIIDNKENLKLPAVYQKMYDACCQFCYKDNELCV